MGLSVIIKNKHPFRLIYSNIMLILRRIKFKFKFKKLGRRLKVHGKISIYGDDISVGDYVSLNEGIILNASRSKIKIGNHCTLSANVQLHATGLEINKNYKNRKHTAATIILEDGVWLCAGVIVAQGITIGKASIVAAGSVVTKDIPPFELWGGIPAKKIKDIK